MTKLQKFILICNILFFIGNIVLFVLEEISITSFILLNLMAMFNAANIFWQSKKGKRNL